MKILSLALGLLFLSSPAFAVYQVGRDANQISLNKFLGSMAAEDIKNYAQVINVKYTASATSVANTGVTQIDADTVYVAKNGSIDGSGNFIPPRTGNYTVCYKVGFASATYVVGNIVYAYIDVGGVIQSITPALYVPSTTYSPTVATCDLITLTAGTTVKLYAANNRTAGASSIDTTGYNTYLSYVFEGDN